MIRGYADHAANERTFLAWVRTGIAVIAFGFVVAKFNIFVATIASATLANSEQRQEFAHLSGPLGRYGGLALIVGGIMLIVLSTMRFVRTTRLLDDPREPGARSGERTRPLPAIFAECYGDITPGDRGGIICNGTRLRATIRLIPIPADSHRH